MEMLYEVTRVMLDLDIEIMKFWGWRFEGWRCAGVQQIGWLVEHMHWRAALAS
jgi:hypothetical protein